MAKLSKEKAAQKKRYNEVLKIINSIANTKGWGAYFKATDDLNYHHATISVSRDTGVDTIKGDFEVNCDRGVKLRLNKTSFYGYGLLDLKDAVWDELCKLPWLENPKKAEAEKRPRFDEKEIVVRLLRRFHIAVRQLKHRYDDRPRYEVKDEYDVQDLLHVFLRGLFDDVRPEEYTPSYAGGSSRVDFLLKSEKMAIEVKMASASLRDKQIGEQLLIDIGRYKAHQDCKSLVCFVYDPNGNLKNPPGLEADLTKVHDGLDVRVIIVSP